MKERRKSDRIRTIGLFVSERNGDYTFTLEASNLSKDGFLAKNKQLSQEQEYVSYLSFSLPNGVHLENVTAKIVHEKRFGQHKGVGYHFIDMDKRTLLELKKYFQAA